MASAATDTVLVSFSAGEWNPRLDTRPDLGKAKSACRTLKNFRLAIAGPAVKRPGLRFIAPVRVAPVPPVADSDVLRWQSQVIGDATIPLDSQVFL